MERANQKEVVSYQVEVVNVFCTLYFIPVLFRAIPKDKFAETIPPSDHWLTRKEIHEEFVSFINFYCFYGIYS